jgi:hypothetical protein
VDEPSMSSRKALGLAAGASGVLLAGALAAGMLTGVAAIKPVFQVRIGE